MTRECQGADHPFQQVAPHACASGVTGAHMSDKSGNEILRMAALVALLGIAFVALLIEPTQAATLNSAR